MSTAEVFIDRRAVGPAHPCFVIAETGVNHNGDPGTALAMIDAAAEAGVDCVKFQTFSAEEFVNSPGEVYEYELQGKIIRESMLGMFQRLELERQEFPRLFEYARRKGLIPLSTPTDRAAADLLDELGTGAFKIGSDDLVYTPFIRHVAQKGKPVIISTGMSAESDVARAVDTILEMGNRQIVILHCVSLYPTPEEAVNLRRLPALASEYTFPIGFSDHSWGITAALGAVALGACVVEKHFTLDRNMAGPDHRFSADPPELTALVREIRRLEANLGTGQPSLTTAETEMAELCHRSIVLDRDLPAGAVIKEADLAYRRPGNGLLPYQDHLVVGRRLRTAQPAGTQIDLAMLEVE